MKTSRYLLFALPHVELMRWEVTFFVTVFTQFFLWATLKATSFPLAGSLAIVGYNMLTDIPEISKQFLSSTETEVFFEDNLLNTARTYAEESCSGSLGVQISYKTLRIKKKRPQIPWSSFYWKSMEKTYHIPLNFYTIYDWGSRIWVAVCQIYNVFFHFVEEGIFSRKRLTFVIDRPLNLADIIIDQEATAQYYTV